MITYKHTYIYLSCLNVLSLWTVTETEGMSSPLATEVRARKITVDLELVLPIGASETGSLCAICLEPAGPEGFRELQCNPAKQCPTWAKQ